LRRAGAGVCARRRSNFLLSRQEKVTKEKATLLCVSLRCATGNLRCSGRGCAAELTARLQRSVQTTAASQCTKCVCPTAHARTPCPALLGTHRREPATGHPHGPSLRSAPSARAQAPRAALSRPNAAMARMAVGLLGCWAVGLLGCWAATPLLYAPGARRRRGGVGVPQDTPALRQLTRRVCLNGAPQARSELRGAPRIRAPQVAGYWGQTPISLRCAAPHPPGEPKAR